MAAAIHGSPCHLRSMFKVWQMTTPNGRRSFISEEDLQRCKALVHDIMFKFALPQLERAARVRNEELSASRKTLKSQFGRFFKATFGGSYSYTKPRAGQEAKWCVLL